MKYYWIDYKEEPKVVEKLDKDEAVELELRDEEDKQWLKAKVKVFGEPGKKTAGLKVFHFLGRAVEREYYIEPLEIRSMDD